MMRAQLIEFTPDSATRSRKPWSLNMSFTRLWQSSKLPSTASACTLAAVGVVICRCCTGDTLPCGKRMKMSVRSRPAKASIAAPPVSPEVAPAIVARWPRSASTWSISRASSCIATSLKASVGPWKSSRTKVLAPSLHQRADRFVPERGIGFTHQPLEDGRRDFAAEIWRQQAHGEVGIGQAAHGADFSRAELRPFLRHVEPAVARKARKHGIRETEDRRVSARAHIFHALSSPSRSGPSGHQLIRAFAGSISPVAFSPRGCYRAAALREGMRSLWRFGSLMVVF